jgi:hypothetical protein
MTYAQAQDALITLGHALNLTALEGRSVSGLLVEILVASNVTDKGRDTVFDNDLATALGITL